VAAAPYFARAAARLVTTTLTTGTVGICAHPLAIDGESGRGDYCTR
jgi:hypothetical protein